MITKVKLRRWLHLGGLLIAGGAGVAIWLSDLHLPLSAKLGATGALVTTLLTSLDRAMPRVIGYVNELPIPETETTTTTTTTVTTAAVQPSDVDDITQNIRKGQT